MAKEIKAPGVIIKQSIRDMIRIYRPKRQEVPAFIKRYIIRYKIENGFQEQLERVAYDELKRLEEASNGNSR